MWTTEEQARLTKYMDGDYADICEWSAYTATPNAFKLPHPDWTADSVSSDDKALVAKEGRGVLRVVGAGGGGGGAREIGRAHV